MKHLLISFLFLISTIRAEDLNFKRLTTEENEERLKKCGLVNGKPPGDNQDVWIGRLSKHEGRPGHSLDVEWPYVDFLGVLISPRHVVFGHTRHGNFDFENKHCRDK